MATDKPSKSARKREFLALQDLGEQLLTLTRAQLDGIHMSDELREAVLHAQKITAHGALRRQKQLIGKLMRHTDAEPIRTAINALQSGVRADKMVFRDAEAWRDRIVSEGQRALEEFIAGHGGDNPVLLQLANSLQRADNDRQRKDLKRRMFREIHRELSSQVQRDTN